MLALEGRRLGAPFAHLTTSYLLEIVIPRAADAPAAGAPDAAAAARCPAGRSVGPQVGRPAPGIGVESARNRPSAALR